MQGTTGAAPLLSSVTTAFEGLSGSKRVQGWFVSNGPGMGYCVGKCQRGLRASLRRAPSQTVFNADDQTIQTESDVEQKLVELACSDPPQGRCHWTLQLLADELVVLGLVDTISTVTVWQALKKTTSSRGSSKPGVFRLKQTRSTSGAWRT